MTEHPWMPEEIADALAQQPEWSRRERWSLKYMPKVWKWGMRLGLLRERKDGNQGWIWKRKPTFYTAESMIQELWTRTHQPADSGAE